MNELCGANYPDTTLTVLCGMPIGPNALNDAGKEVHVHAGYGTEEIPPEKYRWEDSE